MPPNMRIFNNLYYDSMDIYSGTFFNTPLSGAVDSSLANQQSQMWLINSNANAGSGDNYISLG